MGYLRNKAKNWLHRHPSLHSFYHQRKFQRITAPLRRLPDFVIIGAQKSGTTSLYDFVVKHPAIISAAQKETEYFSRRYKFGEMWYRSNFPTSLSRYHLYKKTDERPISGEATPNYLFYPFVPGRMKKTLPDVKLVVILRNPVDRAFSQYHHTVRMGRETREFEAAVKQEVARRVRTETAVQDPNFAVDYRHAYLGNGVYADRLENWFKHYERNRFLILATEDLRKTPQRTLDQVFDFLEVAPFQVKNIRDLNVGSYKTMNKNTRKCLVEYFKPHNEKLYRLLKRSFDWDK